MAISTKINIEIAGEQLTRFSKLVINQKVQSHHKFSLMQPLPKEFVSQGIDKAQEYVGKNIKVEIAPATMSTASPLIFHGIITEAQVVRTSGASGGIIISGYSPTILLERTPHIRSFSEKSLSDIVNEVLKSYSKEDLKPSVSVEKDATLPYTVQYTESDFLFLCRMAQKKGQWFYFNGEELNFGKPKPKKFVLEYGRSLHSFNIEMRAKSLGFEYLGYDSSNGESQKANSMEVNHQPQGYSKTIFDTSKKLFPNNSTILYSHALEEGNSRTHLVDRVTTQLQSRTADLVTAKGDSDETGLRIGDVIEIKEPSFSLTGNVLDGLQEQNFGNYLITDIMHICDESGNYHNSFDAVPEDVASPPYGNVHSFPVAESQPATVMSNDDPAGLGRIQVAFAWQKESGAKTPWIRMTNPHSGGGKGFYFIPEVGEEVLIAFEGGNAEKPFVLGAMYNGSASSGYSTPENNIKAIHTRSGHIIKLDDSEGAESITITDKNKNIVFIDTANNNIEVTANETMTFNAKNMLMNVTENLDIRVGKNMTESIAKDHTIFCSNMLEMVEGNKTIQVGEAFEQSSAMANLIALNGDMNIKGSGLATFQGGNDVKVSKAK